MPITFQLVSKQSGLPAILQEVDAGMRNHFGADADDNAWYSDWYREVGYMLALGNTYDEVRAILRENMTNRPSIADLNTTLLAVVDWLEDRYSPECGYSPKWA